MTTISASVGLGAINRKPDVAAVQRLLARAGASPGPIDGISGRRTIGAIERFQHGFLPHPDGRVDVHGPTLQHLNAAGHPAHPTPAAHPARPPAVRPFHPAVVQPARPPHASHPVQPPHPAQPVQPIRPATPPAVQAHPAGGQDPYTFWTGRTLLPSPDCNRGLSSPSARQLVAMLGDPTAARVERNVATESVGPFRATGLKPALASMRQVMGEVHRDLPDLYNLLQSSGMRVVRHIRNASSYSLHSWGIAIDLGIKDKLPPYGCSYSLRGLDAIAPYFNRHGWYWGGGYRNVHRKDPMHFECGLALVQSWGL